MSYNYEFGAQQIAVLNSKLAEASFDYEKEVSLAIKNCPSMLDTYDYTFAIVIGILGAVIDTNEKLETFLDQVHQAANSSTNTGNAFIDFLAKLLHHQGDWIDKVPTMQDDGHVVNKFVNRAAKKIKRGVWQGGTNTPHRIFWGHDILSFHQDNPIYISIKQYGAGRGILQAIRHLVADTCSKQGLPIPGSSWFDYVGEIEANGNPTKICNHLLDFCQKYSKEVLGYKQGGVNNDVFNHVFSIHMQDALSSGLVFAGVKGYCKARDIIDDDRIIQMRIIAYGFNFFGAAIIGAATRGGIPYINWPCFLALVKNVIQMIHVTNKDIEKLVFQTELLISEGINVEAYEQRVRMGLLYSLHEDIIGVSPNKRRDDLIAFLGKE